MLKTGKDWQRIVQGSGVIDGDQHEIIPIKKIYDENKKENAACKTNGIMQCYFSESLIQIQIFDISH